MATLKITLDDGTISEIKGKIFNHPINETPYRFFLCRLDKDNVVLAHYDTGTYICHVMRDSWKDLNDAYVRQKAADVLREFLKRLVSVRDFTDKLNAVCHTHSINKIKGV